MRSIANSSNVRICHHTDPVSSAYGVVMRGLVAGVVVLVGGGCQLMTNPFRDEFAGSPPVTTPSVEGILLSDTTPEPYDRGFTTVEAEVADGSVTHGPLLFEDDLDDIWDGDDRFAVSHRDVGQWFVWQGRFAINLVAVGGSMMMTPPWTVMVSDGSPGRSVVGETYDVQLP